MKTKTIKTLNNSNSKDFWNELSKKQKSLIDKAIKEADEGKFTDHNEVMSKFREKHLIITLNSLLN